MGPVRYGDLSYLGEKPGRPTCPNRAGTNHCDTFCGLECRHLWVLFDAALGESVIDPELTLG